MKQEKIYAQQIFDEKIIAEFLGAMEDILRINSEKENNLFEGDIRLTSQAEKNLEKNAVLNSGLK